MGFSDVDALRRHSKCTRVSTSLPGTWFVLLCSIDDIAETAQGKENTRLYVDGQRLERVTLWCRSLLPRTLWIVLAFTHWRNLQDGLSAAIDLGENNWNGRNRVLYFNYDNRVKSCGIVCSSISVERQLSRPMHDLSCHVLCMVLAGYLLHAQLWSYSSYCNTGETQEAYSLFFHTLLYFQLLAKHRRSVLQCWVQAGRSSDDLRLAKSREFPFPAVRDLWSLRGTTTSCIKRTLPCNIH